MIAGGRKRTGHWLGHVGAALLVAACASVARPTHVTAQEPPPVASRVELSGTARNLAVDRTSGVTLTVERATTGLWTVSGAFDGVTLFGRFDTVPGRDLECETHSPGATCILFVGILLLGADGSGFEAGTAASLTISLVLHDASATGAYRIGPVGSHDHDQYGTLELSVF